MTTFGRQQLPFTNENVVCGRSSSNIRKYTTCNKKDFNLRPSWFTSAAKTELGLGLGSSPIAIPSGLPKPRLGNFYERNIDRFYY